MSGRARKLTVYAHLKPWQARLALVALVLLMGYGATLRVGAGEKESRSKAGNGDAAMYRAVASRMHEGEGYYEVAGDELRERGYATTPFFNWRLPTLAVLLSFFPSIEWGLIVLAPLGIVTVWLWLNLFVQEGSSSFALVGALLLGFGLLHVFVPMALLFHETWAGVLIAFSLGAYARGWVIPGVAAGVGTVFIRELALPFLGVMFLMAVLERKKIEAVAWFLGGVAFAIFLYVHATLVALHMTEAAQAHEGWFYVGGWRFILYTGQASVLLMFLPSFIVAVIFPLMLLGAGALTGPVGRRLTLTVLLYVAAYFVVGRSMHWYWGLLYAPLLSVGLLFAPRALAQLVQCALGKPVENLEGAQNDDEDQPSTAPAN